MIYQSIYTKKSYQKSIKFDETVVCFYQSIYTLLKQLVLRSESKKIVSGKILFFNFHNSPNFLYSQLFSNVARLFSILDLVTLQISAFPAFQQNCLAHTLLHQIILKVSG